METIDAFSGVSAWASLSPEHRDRIGALTMEILAARRDQVRPAVAAAAKAEADLFELMAQVVRIEGPSMPLSLLYEPAGPANLQGRSAKIAPTGDDYDRGRRDMLNALLAPNPHVSARLAAVHDRPADPDGRLPFDIVYWIAEVAEQLGILPMEDLAETGDDVCPGHVASPSDPKVCGRCGIHIDALRPPDDDPVYGEG